jgi:hypothetical protein
MAAPTFVISVGENLYVRTGATQNMYTLSDNITSLAVAPDGKIYGTSPSDDGNGTYELYRLDNPTTAPTLSLIGDFLTYNTPTLSFVGNTLYGVQTIPGAPNTQRLVTIDLNLMTETIVGQTGNTGTDNLAGSGYDAASGIFYAMGKGPNGELNDLDYNVVPPFDPSVSLIGNASIQYVNHGGEFYQGTMYGAVQGVATGGGANMIKVDLGSISTGDGSFTQIANIIDNFDQSTLKDGLSSVGLAVIPAPGAAALSSLAGLLLLRRRR